MNEALKIAFEECLAAYEQGASLEDSLQIHPEFASQLRPELEAIQRTRALAASIQLRPGRQAMRRAQFLTQAARQAGAGTASFQNPARPWSEKLAWLTSPLARKMAAGMLALMIVFLTGSGVLNASAQSLPGSPFFGLKRSIEETRLAFTPPGVDKARLEDELQETRRLEAIQVTEQRLPVSLEFGGPLEAMEGEHWKVGGLAVSVPAGTPIQGRAQIGLYMHIRGQAQADQSIRAEEVMVQGLIFQDQLESVAMGTWQVGGRVVFTCDDTKVKGGPRPGDLVEVNARRLADGSLLAEQIERVGSHRQPGGGEAPRPEDKPGGEPVGQPTEAQTAESGKDGLPSGGSDGGGSAEPTRTPSASSGAGASQTPQPSRTPGQDGKSGPSQTPQPTHASGGGQSPTAAPSSTPAGREVRLQGMVEKIGGSAWVVSGQAVQVNGSTAIDSGIKTGDMVEVRGMQQAGGSLLASSIQKK